MIVRAKEAFAYTDDTGVPRIVSPGQLFDSSDPCVAKRGNLFEPVELAVTRSETATATPGEVRSVGRPRRKFTD